MCHQCKNLKTEMKDLAKEIDKAEDSFLKSVLQRRYRNARFDWWVMRQAHTRIIDSSGNEGGGLKRARDFYKPLLFFYLSYF